MRGPEKIDNNVNCFLVSIVNKGYLSVSEKVNPQKMGYRLKVIFRNKRDIQSTKNQDRSLSLIERSANSLKWTIV